MLLLLYLAPSHPLASTATTRWRADSRLVATTGRLVDYPVAGAPLVLEITSSSATLGAVVDVDIRGRAAVVRGTARRYSSEIAESGDARLCAPADRGALRCHVPVSVAANSARITIIPLDTAGARVSTNVRYTRSGVRRPFSDGRLAVILLGLLLVTPLLWRMHAHRVASEWMLVLIATTALAGLEPAFTAALLILLTVLYGFGHSTDAEVRKRGMLIGVLVAVLFLFGWKYAPDVSHGLFAITLSPAWALPLGVSYFCIRLIDTQLRWYRGELLDVSYREYLCFLLFPATIPAGPIETLDRFHLARLEHIGASDIGYGLQRMAIGAFKKIVLADAVLYPLLFAPDGLYQVAVLDPGRAQPWRVVQMGIVSLLFAYVDFSAYSDIAIGLGRLHGYRIRENFNWPLIAASLQDFWRRWHISLSQWCMRNIYFPLVLSTRTALLPLLATMLAVGLWHEFDQSWYAWAVHHAIGLAVSVWVGKRLAAYEFSSSKIVRAVKVAGVVLFVAAGHMFVLVSDFPTALRLYGRFWRAFVP